jgi:aryl-alcohol dehydrogenase-like predicted oxidoreductase
MIRRSFGNGVRVSVLGIGCGRVGSISNPVPTREIEATLELAVEAGVNLFDTADIYGQGDSERTLGRLLRRHGDSVFVITKVGGRHSRYAGMARLAKPLLRTIVRSRPSAGDAIVAARTATVAHDFILSDLSRAIEASRRRLGLDELHGLLLHSPSADTLRKPEIHDFLGEALHRRKSARVGASVDTLDALEAALSIPSLTMIEAPVEVASNLSETAILGGMRGRNIGLFVREILRKARHGSDQTRSPSEALSAAVGLDFVTSAIVGVSTRRHLSELLPTVT